MKTKKYPKFKSWRDLYDRAKGGDEMAQKAIICGLSNLGHTPTSMGYGYDKKSSLWQRAYHGLQEYIGALVGEYGETEEKAEEDILAEVNHVLDVCHYTKLED